MKTMPEMLEKLRMEFQYILGRPGNEITMSVNHMPNVREVRAVEVRLEGEHPLTGEKIDKQIFRFTKTSSQRQSESFSYHGSFWLHFDAVTDQQTYYDFKEKIPVNLINEKNEPKIEYSCMQERGWTVLKIYTNCPRRCSGKLWVKVNGHYQKIPQINQENSSFAIPSLTFEQLEVQDERLPKPKRRCEKFERLK